MMFFSDKRNGIKICPLKIMDGLLLSYFRNKMMMMMSRKETSIVVNDFI